MGTGLKDDTVIFVDKIPLRCPACRTPIHHFSLLRLRLDPISKYSCVQCNTVVEVGPPRKAAAGTK